MQPWDKRTIKYESREVSMDTERLLLTIPEVAVRMGLGRSLVYQLVMSGDIPSIKLGRARRVPAKALDQFIEERLKEAFLEG